MRSVPLRVVIIGLPQLVTDVLVYACNWPGRLEVAAAVPEGQLTSETDAELVIMTHQPDVIVVRADEKALDRIADLRMRHCHQVVVGIALTAATRGTSSSTTSSRRSSPSRRRSSESSSSPPPEPAHDQATRLMAIASQP